MFVVYLMLMLVFVGSYADTPTQIPDENGSVFKSDFPSDFDLNATFFVSQIFNKYGDSHVLTYEGFEHLLASLGLGQVEFDKRHDVSLHKINGSFHEIHDLKELHTHWHTSQRRRRHPVIELKELRPQCLSPQQILKSYGLEPDHDVSISPEGFQKLCPAIVYELDQKHCWTSAAPVNQKPNILRNPQAWLEASVSILVMSISGLLCAAIVPVLNRCHGNAFLHFLVAIACGTLAGDALIHLLPHALTYDHNSESKTTALMRATVTLTSIVIFYIMECTLRIINKTDKGHSHQLNSLDSVEKDKMLPRRDQSHESDGSLSCVVIAGDILHNVTDGLSIGAAFSTNQAAGLACAIAVFCHELPHELGDYAVLLRQGMSVQKALLCNLFSSIFSFGGMALGLLLGEVMHAAPWVNSFTAGSFLYIALANLVPELKKETDIKVIILQLVGILSGIVLMFFIGLYEDDWQVLLATSR